MHRPGNQVGNPVVVRVGVEKILQDPVTGAARGVRYRDMRTGGSGDVTARLVVNATGAWGPITAAQSTLPSSTVPIRPSKGIHVVFDRRVTNFAIVADAIDGRQIFIEPWQNVSLLGATDDDYYGDLDDCHAVSDEVRYLMQGISRVLPACASARVIGTTAGVRPTLHRYGVYEDRLSRDHRIVDHSPDGAPGLYSMVGGKLASYRLFSEEMVDVLCRSLRRPGRCTSHLSKLPGGESIVSPKQVLAHADRCGLDAIAASRIFYRHGARAPDVLARIERRPEEGEPVCICEPVLEAEVRHVVAKEYARDVDDVARRTRLGLGACGGMRCASRCGQIVADELGLAPIESRRMTLGFLHRQMRARAPALGHLQIAQEGIALAAMRSEWGLDQEEPES